MTWTQPKYPGDAVRQILLTRTLTLDSGKSFTDGGDIRIQHYNEKVRVAAFLPGYMIHYPGDTPKMEPEHEAWFLTEGAAEADARFDLYLKMAKSEGWVVLEPQT
jgi:hypothetical protein